MNRIVLLTGRVWEPIMKGQTEGVRDQLAMIPDNWCLKVPHYTGMTERKDYDSFHVMILVLVCSVACCYCSGSQIAFSPYRPISANYPRSTTVLLSFLVYFYIPGIHLWETLLKSMLYLHLAALFIHESHFPHPCATAIHTFIPSASGLRLVLAACCEPNCRF